MKELQIWLCVSWNGVSPAGWHIRNQPFTRFVICQTHQQLPTVFGKMWLTDTCSGFHLVCVCVCSVLIRVCVRAQPAQITTGGKPVKKQSHSGTGSRASVGWGCHTVNLQLCISHFQLCDMSVKLKDAETPRTFPGHWLKQHPYDKTNAPPPHII